MTPRQRIYAVYAAWIALAAPGLWQLGLLAYATARRVAYPFDLEWMEGGMLVHAARISEGEGIYVAPSVDFIPYLYTPLYPALIALLGQVFGISYTLGRIISVLALVAVLALMTLAIVRDADVRDRLPAYAGAALAAGLLAATYPWVEGWYDLVRADTLFLAMILGGLVLLRSATGRDNERSARVRVWAAAALLGLSFFCKQTGVLYVAAGGALLLVWCWRLPVRLAIVRLAMYVATAGAIGLGGTWIANRATSGWFWTYVYQVHQVHDFSMDRFYRSFENILWKLPVMTVVIGLALVAVLVTTIAHRKRPRSSAGLLLWSFVFAVSCLVGALGWGTQWAHFNAYMPAMMTGALACGSALVALVGVAVAWTEHRAPRLAHVAGAITALALGCQLYAARWNPRRFVPTERDRAAGHALIEHLRELRQRGEIYVPYHPWYARLAGQKRTYVHRMGILDVTYGNKWRVDGLREALTGARFAAVILDNRPVGPELTGLRQSYRPDDHLPRHMAPRLYSGARVVPQSVWVPIAEKAPPGARVLFDFEDTRLADWTIEGTAWGRRPVDRPVGKQGQVLGYRGRRFLSSMHSGDGATGVLTSPAFALTGKRITFRMSGGAGDALRAELHVDGQRVRSAGNPISSERMREHTWDVAELAGRQARIVLIDRATGSWGHLNVDHVLLREE
jgi:hypothetical protein